MQVVQCGTVAKDILRTLQPFLRSLSAMSFFWKHRKCPSADKALEQSNASINQEQMRKQSSDEMSCGLRIVKAISQGETYTTCANLGPRAIEHYERLGYQVSSSDAPEYEYGHIVVYFVSWEKPRTSV